VADSSYDDFFLLRSHVIISLARGNVIKKSHRIYWLHIIDKIFYQKIDLSNRKKRKRKSILVERHISAFNFIIQNDAYYYKRV